MIEFSTDTNGQDLHKFSLQLGQTKSASSVNVPADLDDRAFANPHSRELPTHTKEATIQSTIYFYGNKVNNTKWASAYPEELVESRLEKSAKFWNAVPEFKEIRDYQPPIEKVASMKDEDFALVGEECSLPCNTDDTILKSAASLIEQKNELPFMKRAEAATNLLIADKNNVLSASTVADLEKMAGVISKEASEAKKQVTLLAHNQDEPLKGSLLKLAATITDPSSFFEYAMAIDDTIDKKAFCVEDLFFDRKEVEPTFTLTNGKEVKVASIKEAGTDPFAVLGEGIPFSVSDGKKLDYKKAQTFLSNMSRPDSDLYYKALNSFLR
jgi:hypothetical protein